MINLAYIKHDFLNDKNNLAKKRCTYAFRKIHFLIKILEWKILGKIVVVSEFSLFGSYDDVAGILRIPIINL